MLPCLLPHSMETLIGGEADHRSMVSPVGERYATLEHADEAGVRGRPRNEPQPLLEPEAKQEGLHLQYFDLGYARICFR